MGRKWGSENYFVVGVSRIHGLTHGKRARAGSAKKKVKLK